MIKGFDADFIFDRLGCALLGVLFGLVYAIVVVLALFPFVSSINPGLLFLVFIGVFAVAGLIFGGKIITSFQGCVYSLYVLYGWVLGFFSMAPILNEDVFPEKSNGLFLVVIGIASGMIYHIMLY